MQLSRVARATLVALVSLGMLSASVLKAHADMPVGMKAADVILTQDSKISGQVVSAQAAPKAAAKVTVWRQQNLVTETTTNEKGDFEVRVPSGGVYTIATAEGNSTVRAWTAGSAPPSAAPRVLIVSDEATARGQGFIRRNWVPLGLLGGFAGWTIARAVDDEESGS